LFVPEYDIIVTVVFFSVLVFTVITFFIAILIQYQKRREKHLLEVQTLEHQFSQTLLSSQIEIQEQTLRNISQELHDNISQKLGLAKLQLNLIQANQPTLNVQETKTVIMDAIEDIRALSKSMHPDRIGTIPLKESIEHEVNMLRNASSASFNCTIDADPEILTPDQRIILFRIFQELLNNALKYSQATNVEIMLSFTDHITLSVIDNGIGLPADYQKGIGHTSIQNRVGLIKGTFHLESIPGKGTNSRVEIPKG